MIATAARAVSGSPFRRYPLVVPSTLTHWLMMAVGLKTVGIYPVPFRSDFYILPARFRIFRQIRNKYEIRDVKFENRSKTVCPVSRSFSYFPYLIGISRFHKFEISRFLQPKPTSCLRLFFILYVEQIKLFVYEILSFALLCVKCGRVVAVNLFNVLSLCVGLRVVVDLWGC